MQTLKAKPVWQLIECLANNNDTDLLVLESELTIAKAMDSMHINKLIEVVDKGNIIKAIAFLTLRLSEQFNVGQKFSPTQASILAMDLTEIFSHETLEDVVLMYKMARQGKIGQGADYKLDGQTVLKKWVPEYLELKAIEREEQYQAEGNKNLQFDKWSASDIEKFKTSDKIETVRKGLGERLKPSLEAPSIIPLIKDRQTFLKSMRVEVKNQSTESLKSYLVKNDINSNRFDQELYNLAENELDLRNKL